MMFLFGQEQALPDEGTVSYITSQNVYVQFKSTANIQAGDTLFIDRDNVTFPALVVVSKSSISCVCSRISDIELKVNDKLFTRSGKIQPIAPQETPSEKPLEIVTEAQDTVTGTEDVKKKRSQSITGRVAISSYLNFSNTPGGNSQRMRYTTSLNAKNIGGSRLSAEYYISFNHRSDHWDEIQEDVLNGLKIYNLAVCYQFTDNTRILVGRKVNPKLSSVGAIDGLQFETKFKSFSYGLIVGSRPDYSNYGYDPGLFQVGGYISHDYVKGKGNMQSTLAFVDQENSWNTDRRFIYFQHYNTLFKNLYFFGSVEFDLYENIEGQASTTFNPTNFYLLFRYKVIKQLTLSFSYSARNNIIYYETYKDIVERLLESTTLQGVSFQAQYRPLAKLSVGAKAGYRFRKEDPKPSWNADGYVTYSQVPALKISVTGSATFMQTSYTKGKIFSLGITRDILPGKVYCGINYRYVDYSFYTNETSVAQNMAEVNLNWNIYKKLLFSVYYEGTFERQNKYSRIYLNLTQRF